MPPGQSGIHRSGNMTGTRKTQNVETLAERKRAMLWMCKESQGGRDKKLPSRAVKQFPTFFRRDMKTNLQKAGRWAKIRDEYIAEAHRCANAAYHAGSGFEACAHKI
jgi:hypothetical protein